MVSTFGTCPSGTWFGQTAAIVELHSDGLNRFTRTRVSDDSLFKLFLLKLLKWTVHFFLMSFIVVDAIR